MEFGLNNILNVILVQSFLGISIKQ